MAVRQTPFTAIESPSLMSVRMSGGGDDEDALPAAGLDVLADDEADLLDQPGEHDGRQAAQEESSGVKQSATLRSLCWRVKRDSEERRSGACGEQSRGSQTVGGGARVGASPLSKAKLSRTPRRSPAPPPALPPATITLPGSTCNALSSLCQSCLYQACRSLLQRQALCLAEGRSGCMQRLQRCRQWWLRLRCRTSEGEGGDGIRRRA